jgi:hypothetical protein
MALSSALRKSNTMTTQRDLDRPQTRFWNSTLAPHLHQAIGRLFGEAPQLMGER